MALIIKNGIVVSSEKSIKADICIQNGKINTIAKNIKYTESDKIINAEGKYIFPGGIDPHVHMHLPVFAGYSADDFYTGGIAALYGGTSTIIDFVTPNKDELLPEAFEKRLKEAEKSPVNYSFHVSPVKWRDSLADELDEIIEQGCTSFKVYMAYKESIGLDDEDLYRVMQRVAKKGALLTVHAELGDEIDKLRNTFAAAKKLEPKYHPLSRPANTEALAVKKIIDFAEKTGCVVYIVHVSSSESLKYIAKAQKKGLKIFAETCPHYLLLNDEKYNSDFEQAAPYVLSPPLRKKADNEALWEAIKNGIIQTVGTDHCPFNMLLKRKGLNDFRYIPNGAGSVEHRLALLYTYGVLTNKISIHKFVDIVATQPAKIFGLYPRKGKIQEGSDADIVIWNPEIQNTISAKTHHQNCDNSIYEGVYTKGAAETVIVNGRLVIYKGVMKENSKGVFLKRKLAY